jgi:hypothetical protein
MPKDKSKKEEKKLVPASDKDIDFIKTTMSKDV